MLTDTRLLAVCHTCGHRHGISLGGILHGNAVRDWEVKHSGHVVEFLDPAAHEVSAMKNAGVSGYRHNADIKLAYAASAAYTITLGGLATSSTLVAGRESAGVVNTSNLYVDYIIGGKIKTGTSPTVNKTIQVIAIGAINDTPTYPDVFDGTDSAETFTSLDIKNSISRFAANMNVSADSDRDYWFGPVSLVSLFGVVPRAHVLFVTHDTAVNLNATDGNHVLNYNGVYYTAI